MSKSKKVANGWAVRVDWLDSTRINAGWAPAPDYSGYRSSPTHVRTIGILLKANRERVVVALSSSDWDHWCDAISIPRAAVTRMRRLR